MVWLPTRPTDTAESSEAMSGVIGDPRVIHYWDESRVVSEWYKAQLDPDRSFVLYDTYFVYDTNAEWDNLPDSLVGWGGTIYGERQALETELLPLLTKASQDSPLVRNTP